MCPFLYLPSSSSEKLSSTVVSAFPLANDTQNSLQLRFQIWHFQTVPQTSLPTWPYAFCIQHLQNSVISQTSHLILYSLLINTVGPSQRLNQGVRPPSPLSHTMNQVLPFCFKITVKSTPSSHSALPPECTLIFLGYL
ncbi:hypothetical protein HJG60_010593 [Phyllostomus discolor]|uniref:Uncharacterized protein n=1 Tax=Phyllostomus discolor TaxID=89673 RepID=A0A834ANF5_9CHIR|nr:hypothetical protein HJG60_010593 [Phyllostomus discolor]